MSSKPILWPYILKIKNEFIRSIFFIAVINISVSIYPILMQQYDKKVNF